MVTWWVKREKSTAVEWIYFRQHFIKTLTSFCIMICHFKMKRKHNPGNSFRINIASYITHKSNNSNPHLYLLIYSISGFWQFKHRSSTVFVQISSIKFHRILYKSLKILCFSSLPDAPPWLWKQDRSSAAPAGLRAADVHRTQKLLRVRLLKSCTKLGGGEDGPNQRGLVEQTTDGMCSWRNHHNRGQGRGGQEGWTI